MHKLYTYRNITELRRIQSESEVYNFIFEETQNQLEHDACITLDITTLVSYLRAREVDIYAALLNLREITEETKVIARVECSEDVIEFFPHIFSEIVQYYNTGDTPIPIKKSRDFLLRKKLYCYSTISEFNKLISYVETKGALFTTFSKANGEFRSKIEELAEKDEKVFVDLTSVSYAIENNKHLIYALELLSIDFDNILFILPKSQSKEILDYLPFVFDESIPIGNITHFESPEVIINSIERVKIVTELDTLALDKFFTDFRENLVGHNNFKKNFETRVRNFIHLNKAKQKKILSVFLYGASGIGKSEVARQIANCLSKSCNLPKINFQNYSSQDALNSLIGSPAGYIGCEHGELSDKIKKSKVGVLLCDEFEKTTRQVHSFFLELLEDGKFTDSMAREYEMDGYIIVFTSNIKSETEYTNVIPTEIQTRLDLVCEFSLPSASEKKYFVLHELNIAKETFADDLNNLKITDDDFAKLVDLEFESFNSLRELKSFFYNRLMELFQEKQIENAKN